MWLHRHDTTRDAPDDDLSRLDTSFVLVPGLADVSGVSLRSLNHPDHVVRWSSFR